MSPSTNPVDSDLNSQQCKHYDGSLASRVSGFESVRWSNIQTSRTSSPTHSEPEPVSVTIPSTVLHRGGSPSPSTRHNLGGPTRHNNQSLRRALKDYHIFLIAISALIGMGYYVRTGTLLHAGGEAAVVYTYSFLGILSLMVMKGLTIMLRIWPVGGALIIFVEEFVDKDVARSVAFLYWLTYCFSFASLITTIGSVVDYWGPDKVTSVGISVLFVFLPILANLTDIRVFRNIELVAGSLKLVIALMIILMMNIINPRTLASLKPRDIVFHHSGPAAGGWFASLLSSIFLGSFSFVGIEVVAATAQEALFLDEYDRAPPAENASIIPDDDIPLDFRPPPRDETLQVLNTTAKNPFQYAHWIPIITTFIYLWGGWIVSHNVPWDSEDLPALPWSSKSGGSSKSIFVTSAKKYSDRMGTAVNVLLLLNVASTSSIALYVASRTLFGFAYTYTKTHDADSSRILEVMSWLSVKSKFDVPYRAVIVSSWLFWLPFLKYLPSPDTYLNVIDVVAEMASVSCILVWAFESLAAFYFYGCLKQSPDHGLYERIKKTAMVNDRVWYLSHRTMAALSAALCFSVVIVGGVMMSISNPNPFQYCAAFVPLGIFIFPTWAWKIRLAARGRCVSYRYPRFKYGVELDTAHAEGIFQRLNNHLKHSSQGNLPGEHRR